jgi:hypothetical protein
MRAPKNIAKINYTTGEKYLDSNYNPYTGYYCEVKGKAYPGKVYTGRSKQLILASSLVKNNKVNGYYFNLNDVIPEEDEEGNISTDEKFILRYFIKYIHTIPIYIKEIDINTYNSVKNNPLYQTVVLNCDVTGGFRKGGTFNIDEVEQADKIMHGIKLYLQDELL